MPILRKALEANSFADFRRFVLRGQQGDQMQPKLHSRAGSARGGDFPVGDDAFVGEDVRQFVGDREVRRIPPIGEYAGVVQHGRCGADGREPAVGGVLLAHDFAQAACAPNVVLVHTQRREGAPAVESRWLWRLPSILPASWVPNLCPP